MKKEKIKLPLSRKLALMVTVFALSLSLVLIAMSYLHYKGEMIEHYETFAMNIASLAASQINADRIETYLETGEKDAEYEETYRRLSDIREHGGVEFVYVVKPEEDEVWYVLDTDPTEGAIPLGYHEPYYEGAFADNAEKMARGEKIDPIVSDEEFGWLMSVYYPLRTSDGEPAGYVGVDIRMNDVRQDMQSFALRMALLMLVLTTLFLLMMITISSKTIATPIRRLSSAAEQLVEAEQSGANAETDIFRQLTIRSNDEIGELYRSLSQMEQDMNVHIRELLAATAKTERITAELSLATRIQMAMLPHVFPAFPEREDFDVYASMNPAKEVGGDFYDFFLIDDDHLCLVMADVSGKGIPAALFMMISKIILQSCAMLGRSAADILTKTNEAICSNDQEEMFVTVWLGILELSTGKLTAANAGHEYPVLKRKDESFEMLRGKHGLVIGGMKDVSYKEYELQMEPGAKLFLYTDGVTEAMDPENRMFGTERMLEALNRDREATPQQLLENVRSAVDGFVRDAEQFDDMTMMCLEYRGAAKTAEEGKMLTIDALTENLPTVQAFVEEALEKAACPMKAQMEISMAVEEIFVNIASYAYGPGMGKASVSVEVTDEPRTAVITFTDHGVPYDPTAKEDPNIRLSAEEREIGGLGIYMTKKMMDKLSYEYRDGQNIFKMTKNL